MKFSKIIFFILIFFISGVTVQAKETKNTFFEIQLEYLNLAYYLKVPLCDKFNQTYTKSYQNYNQKTFNELSNYFFYQMCLGVKQIRERKECLIPDKIKIEENVINQYIIKFKKAIHHDSNESIEKLPWFLTSWRDIKNILKGQSDCSKLSKLKPNSLGYYQVLNLMPIESKNKLIGTLNENYEINYKDKFIYEEKALMIKLIRQNQNLLPNLNKSFWQSYLNHCFSLNYDPSCASSFNNQIRIKSNLIPISLIRNIETQVVSNLKKKFPHNNIKHYVKTKTREKLQSILEEEVIFIQSSYATLPSLIERYQRLDYLKINKIKPLKIEGKEYPLALIDLVGECMPNYRDFDQIVSNKHELIDNLKNCIRYLKKENELIAEKSLNAGSVKVILMDKPVDKKSYYSFYLKKRIYQKQDFILPADKSNLYKIKVPFNLVEIIRYILFTKDEFALPLLRNHFKEYSDLIY